MAHRGRFYPVHFRRDFNANCDIRSISAFAKKYAIRLHSGTSPGYVVDGEQFILQEIAGPDASTIAWLSPSRTIGIWDWQLRLLVSFPHLPDALLQATWFLYRDVIVVSSWRPIEFDRFNPLESNTQLTWQVLFTDFTTFDRGANFNFSTLNAVGY